MSTKFKITEFTYGSYVYLHVPKILTTDDKIRCSLRAVRQSPLCEKDSCDFCQRQCNGSKLPCGHIFCDECDERLRGFDRSNELTDIGVNYVRCPLCHKSAPLAPLRNRRYFCFNMQTYVFCTLWLGLRSLYPDLKYLMKNVQYDIIFYKPVFGVIRNPKFDIDLRYRAAKLFNEHLVCVNGYLFTKKKLTADHLPVTLFASDPTLCAGCGIFLKPSANEPPPDKMQPYSRGYCGDACCCMSLDDHDSVVALLK